MRSPLVGKGRRVLGRGLDALIPSHGGSVREVRLADIVPRSTQPRTRFDEDSLAELADSIRIHGVIQPLIVTPPDGEGKRGLIAGERRWQAARMAGLETAPVVERDTTAQNAIEIALVENIQREDLSPLEEASAFDRLSRDHGLSQEQIGARIGRSRSSVANTIRLLALPGPVRDALASGEITEGHGRALLGLESPAAMEALLPRVIDDGLNVRQTERLVAALKADRKPVQPREKAPGLAQLESDLQTHLGTKVSVLPGRKRGRIVIEYYSDEELSALVDRLIGTD